jgi:hypothetical protein
MISKCKDALVQRLDLFAAVVAVLVALLITVAACLAILLVPLSSANEGVAMGDALAGGIFMMAIIAAVVAVLAYYQSSRRPSLTTTWSFWDRNGDRIYEEAFPIDASPRNFTDDLPQGVTDPRDLVPLQPAKLELTVENYGEVAAKNVAVMLRLEYIYFSPAPQPPPGSPWSFWTTPWGWKIQWEGGLSRPVYPGQIPRQPTIELTGMWALSGNGHTDWGQVVTFADDLPQPITQPVVIDAAPSPDQVAAGVGTTSPSLPES